jgi:hypothetical protein
MKNFLKVSVRVMLTVLTVFLAQSFFCSDIHATSTVLGGAVASLAQRDRQIFNTISKKYPGIIPSPSYLRIEQVLSNSKSTYEFRFAKTDNEAITEIKLDRNDIFVVTDLAVYLLREDTTKPGLGVLQTFNNLQVFAAATGFTPAHLEVVFNGKLELKVGSKINIENLPMQAFRRVPETQQSASTNLSKYHVDEAKLPLGSLLYLQGNMDTKVTITIPTFSTIAIAAVGANLTNKIVLHPYGYLIRGGAIK